MNNNYYICHVFMVIYFFLCIWILSSLTIVMVCYSGNNWGTRLIGPNEETSICPTKETTKMVYHEKKIPER